MRFSVFCVTAVLCAIPAFAQRGGTAPSAGNAGAGPGAGRSPAPNTPSNNTGLPGSLNTPSSTPFPSNQTLFLSGQVILDDGTPASPDIRIERVCNGRPHLETYTDSKGRFSLQLGAPVAEVDTDAADNISQIPGHPSAARGGMGGTMNPYWNCELRAAYPGYTSDTINLSTIRPFETQLGTIVLHHLGSSKATTISVTSALAPKRAVKDYHKALELIAKQNYQEAEKHLVSATTVYPKYAVAWNELGRLQVRENHLDAARNSFQSAIAADSHYVTPLNELAGLSAQQQRWQEAVKYSAQVISLSPDAFPSSYWYNALGHYEQKDFAGAEKSDRELIKLDTLHEFPQAERMMADLMVRRADYAGAAAHLRAFLSLQPNAPDAPQLRQMVPKLDQAAAQANAQTKSQPANQPAPKQ
jgi:tetratricopeptide (TPR) repeat protein